MAKKQQNEQRQYLNGDLTQVKAVDNKGTFEGIVATNSVDRHGEVINILGIDTKTYMEKNPIVLFGHDYWEAESVIGKALSLTKTKGGQLLSTFELFVDDNPKALLVSKLIKKGVCSLSIGFIPKEIDGDEYTKSEMVEYSVVPVPANGEAAITARSLGLTKKDMTMIKQAFKDDATVNITDDTVEVKGAVLDELEEEAAWQAKWENMRPLSKIYWAMGDVYYDPSVPVTEFPKLLGEVIDLFTQVKDGSYNEPDDDEVTESDDDDEIVEYSVSNAIKKIDDDKLKALEDSQNGSSDAKLDAALKALASATELVSKATLSKEEQETAQEQGTVETDVTDPTVVNTTEETEDNKSEEDEAVAEEVSKSVKEIEKTLDTANISSNNIRQLAGMLKDLAVAVEKKLEEADSVQATHGDSHSTVRKRRLVLREAKQEARKADKMVELVLSELKKY